ncbi:Sensor protein FixL [Pseudovibrio sp. Ad26]|nr:Sensor protein FixL [Pseudovibrio sp. Ad26]
MVGVHWRNVFGGLIVVALGLATLAAIQFRSQMNELERESSALHRSASQLVGQHDAHLTALSAIAVASAGQRPDLFLEVSAAISRFYPRIKDVYLVPFDKSEGKIGTAPLSAEDVSAIRQAAERSTGTPVLLPSPSDASHYFLIKRSPNSDAARYALTLEIDSAQLIASDAPFWSRKNVHIGLSLPEGASLVGNINPIDARFSQALTSVSQPLEIETSMQLGPSELLPVWQALGVVALVLFGYVAMLVGLRQRTQLKQAERDAELARVEAQLTHSMRVNAMGEMASGMAHELTQPLTAILAQLQAGQRLLNQGDTERLSPVLQDAVAQSRRGAAILERLRNWSRPQRGQLHAFDLRNAVQNVIALLSADAESKHTKIEFDVPASGVFVMADQVEMEQVIHNLVRNAVEAQTNTPEARVEIKLKSTSDQAVLDVVDNGPGVDPNILPNLFVPFTTTRDEGTGLGLALSQRLVERADGELTHISGQTGATFRIILPLVDHAKEDDR